MIYSVGCFEGSFADNQMTDIATELAYFARTELETDVYYGLKLLWQDTQYEVFDDHVVIFGNKCSRECVNSIFYLLNTFTDGDFNDYVLDNYCEIPPSIPDIFRDNNSDSGQAKILVGALEALVHSPQEINVVVIGSSSSRASVGGMSYDAIALAFSKLGYRGSFHLFDPDEVEQEHVTGNFVMTHFARKFDYSTEYQMKVNGQVKKITHILDDCWSISNDIIEPKTVLVGDVQFKVPPGSSKFIVDVLGNVIGGLANHSDNPRGVSGGTVTFDPVRKNLLFFGSSSTYGPFDRDYVYSVARMHFPTYNIVMCKAVARAFDPYYSVFNYDCRISTKYLTDYRLPVGYPSTRIRRENEKRIRVKKQYYYFGQELRLFCNIPELTLKAYQIGDGCKTCVHVGRILGSIINYSDVSVSDVFSDILPAIVPGNCYKTSGQKETKVFISIRELARRRVTWESFVEATSDLSDKKRHLMMKVAGISRNYRKIDLVPDKSVRYKRRNYFTIKGFPGFITISKSGEKAYYDVNYKPREYPLEEYVSLVANIQSEAFVTPFVSRILANHGPFLCVHDELDVVNLSGVVSSAGKDTLTYTNSNGNATHIITNNKSKKWIAKLEENHDLIDNFKEYSYFVQRDERYSFRSIVPIDPDIELVNKSQSYMVESDAITFKLLDGSVAIQTVSNRELD